MDYPPPDPLLLARILTAFAKPMYKVTPELTPGWSVDYNMGKWWSHPDRGGETSVRCHDSLALALRRAGARLAAEALEWSFLVTLGPSKAGIICSESFPVSLERVGEALQWLEDVGACPKEILIHSKDYDLCRGLWELEGKGSTSCNFGVKEGPTLAFGVPLSNRGDIRKVIEVVGTREETGSKILDTVTCALVVPGWQEKPDRGISPRTGKASAKKVSK